MEYPVIEIIKDSKDYPQSLLELGNDAPDYILAVGDVSILSKPIAAIISSAQQTEENAFKVGKMFAEIPMSKYHYIYDIEYSVGKSALMHTLHEGGNPIIVFEDVSEDFTENRKESTICELEEILENGGLFVSFHYNDIERYNSETDFVMMSALADVVAVPLCSKRDFDVRRAMNKAEELGKRVLINKEEYINLNK